MTKAIIAALIIGAIWLYFRKPTKAAPRMPEAEARAQLTEAFIGEVIDRIDHEGARDVVRARAAERLRV